MIIKLQILASDIREGTYMNPEDCPITRALRRAGVLNVMDGGIYLRNSLYKQIHSNNADKLQERVGKMYGWTKGRRADVEEPQDFEFDLHLEL